MKSSIRVIFLIIVLVDFYIHGVNGQQSPCPNVYEFKYDGSNWYGEITVPIAGSGPKITLQVVILTGDSVTQQESGAISLLSSNDEVYAAERIGGSIKYKHTLPILKNIPVIRSVKLNDREYCSNPTESIPGATVTSIRATNNIEIERGDSTPVAPQPAPIQPLPIRPSPRPVPVQNPRPQPNFEPHFGNDKSSWLDRMPTSRICGFQKTEYSPIHTIINGEKAGRGDFPWLVALKTYAYVFFCGGSLVSNKHVITAAHCLTSYGLKILIELGRYNHDDLSEKVIIRTVANINIHPDYKQYTGIGDIAIVTLTEEVRFNDKIKPICIWPYGESPIGTRGYVAGWGSDLSGAQQNEPMKTSVSIVSQEKCLQKHDLYKNITSENTYCAGGQGTGPCKGDSGGGMYLVENNRWYLKGIVSTSIGHGDACDVELYAVYADISSYLDWLKMYLS